MRSYSELSTLDTLEDRFNYLVLNGEVGYDTFGFSRWVNQSFYKSKEWRDVRNFVIVRDNGCEMGIEEFPLRGAPHIHHMNPLTMEDIELQTDNLLDPEYLVCVSQRTHNAIHYGTQDQLPKLTVARSAGDTRLW